MPPSLRVLLFAGAREAVGRPELSWPVPSGGITVEELLGEIAARHPKLRPVLGQARFVRNGEYLRGRRARLASGDEFGIHPPYSGG